MNDLLHIGRYLLRTLPFERCADAAKDLLSDGFSGSSDKFPDDYNKIYLKVLELQKRAKEVVDLAKEKQLCN